MIDLADLSSPLVTLACLAAMLGIGAIALHGAADSARRRRLRGPLPDLPGDAAHPPHAEARAERASKHAPNSGAAR